MVCRTCCSISWSFRGLNVFHVIFGLECFLSISGLPVSHIPPPSRSDPPNMEKPRSCSSSQAQWKPSDTLHYVVLVPIKADTICCQEPSDTLQRGNPPLLHLLPTGFKCFWMYIYVVTRRSIPSDDCPQVGAPHISLWGERVAWCVLMKFESKIKDSSFGNFATVAKLYCRLCNSGSRNYDDFLNVNTLIPHWLPTHKTIRINTMFNTTVFIVRTNVPFLKTLKMIHV